MALPPAPTAIRRASALGALVAMVVFTWMITAGSFDLFARQHRAADFHEAQARSLLEGGWAVEPGVLGIEAFEIGDEEHTYFGIVPTLLRLPAVAVAGDELDGRLTQASMLLAVGIGLAALSTTSWTMRWARLGDQPLRRSDLAVAALVPFLGGTSAIVSFLASRPWVYHEAILWGAALSLGAFAALTRFLLGAGSRSLVVASALALGALHSRASVGAGAVAAVAAVGVVVAAVMWGRPRLAELARRVAPTIELSARDLGVVAITLVVAVTSYAAINHARFGELFRLPYERQTYALMSEERQAVLAANGGSFFGLRFVPTTFLQYARPDALDLGRTFPFVGFAPDTTVVGDVEFDTLDPTAGVPATMPLFVVACAAGVWLVGRDVARRGRLAPLAVPLSGAAVGALTCLVFGYVAQRYQGDAMPFFLLASIPTFHAIAGSQGTRRRVLVAGTAVLGVWGIAVGLGLGILYQRQVSPGVPDELRAGLHSAQLTAARWVPGAELPTVLRGDALPAELPDGALFVLGACDGLYWGDARQGWSGVERTETSGRFTLDVEWPEPHPGATLPLVSSGTAGTANVLVVVEQADGSMRIGYVWDEPSGERQSILGRPVEVDRGSSQRLEIVFDPNNVEIRVEIDGYRVYEGYRFFPRPGDAVGTSRAGSEVSPRFGGTIERVPQPKPSLCHDIVSRTEGAARRS